GHAPRDATRPAPRLAAWRTARTAVPSRSGPGPGGRSATTSRPVPPSPAGPRGAPAAELHEVQPGPAERELDLARATEVSKQRVLGVDADAAMQVLRGVRDPEAAFGSPELGG